MGFLIPHPEPGIVWHHTCAARLPFLFLSGSIRPSRRNPSATPCKLPTTAAEVVWFTKDHRCDPTCAAAQFSRTKDVPGVRIGIPIERTVPVDELLHHGWTHERIADDIASGRRLGVDPSKWRCHVGPVPIEDAAVAQIRIGNQWRDIGVGRMTTTIIDESPFTLHVAFDGLEYVSIQGEQADGAKGYLFRRMTLASIMEADAA